MRATISGGLPIPYVRQNIGRTRSLAITTAASAWPSGRGENDQPSNEGGKLVYVRYPGCRHGHVTNPPRNRGHADSGSTHRRTAFTLTLPLYRGWGGVRPIWV